jgi:flagellar motility protein MotE (MotC chaperone)
MRKLALWILVFSPFVVAETPKKELKGHDINIFAESLLKREGELEIKEKDLKMREESLELAKKSFEKQVLDFEELQKKTIACMDDQDKQQEDRLKKIVESVSLMRPADAADLISTQPPEVAVQIIGKLDTTKLAKIFNLMAKAKSAELQTKYLNMAK